MKASFLFLFSLRLSLFLALFGSYTYAAFAVGADLDIPKWSLLNPQIDKNGKIQFSYDQGRGPLDVCEKSTNTGKTREGEIYVEKVVGKIITSNADIFGPLKIRPDDFCIEIIKMKDTPAAYTYPHNGKIVLNPALFESAGRQKNGSINEAERETILAGIMAHEIGHVLANHFHSSRLPMALRLKENTQLFEQTPKLLKLRSDAISYLFMRGEEVNSLSSFLYKNYEKSSPVGVATRNILADLYITEERDYLKTHLYTNESAYETIFKALSQNESLLSEKEKGQLARLKSFDLKTKKISQDALGIVSQFGVDFNYKFEPHLYSEIEADQIGLYLFLNSGYKKFNTPMKYLMNFYEKELAAAESEKVQNADELRSFPTFDHLCSWITTQRGLELENLGHPHMCWRMKAIDIYLEHLGLSDQISKPIQAEAKIHFTQAVMTNTSTSCAGTPFYMKGHHETDHVLLLTSGHCIGKGSFSGNLKRYPQKNEFLIDQSLGQNFGEVVKIYKSYAFRDFESVVATKILFATTTGKDLAILELEDTYADFQKKGLKAYELSDAQAKVGVTLELFSVLNTSKRVCELEAFVPTLTETPFISKNIYRMKKSSQCLAKGGDSGSGAINAKDSKIYAVAQTINYPEKMKQTDKACGFNFPCEVDGDKQLVKPYQTYLSPLHELYSCYDEANRKFDFKSELCLLYKKIL